MFKSVEYSGFEDHPELRALAEHATRVLAGEIGGWHDQIDVVWETGAGDPPAVELTITLTLPTGSGTGTRLLPPSELRDDDLLRSRCRTVWTRALDSLLAKRKEAWDAIIRQPAEV